MHIVTESLLGYLTKLGSTGLEEGLWVGRRWNEVYGEGGGNVILTHFPGDSYAH